MFVCLYAAGSGGEETMMETFSEWDNSCSHNYNRNVLMANAL